MQPTHYRDCWHVVSSCFFFPECSGTKVVYDPKAFIPHAVSLRQTFVHCARFLAAASRRSMGRISVPLCRTLLSEPVPVIALVGRYPTNKLLGRTPLPKRVVTPFTPDCSGDHGPLPQLSPGYFPLGGKFVRVTHPFATLRLASERSTCMPNAHRQR